MAFFNAVEDVWNPSNATDYFGGETKSTSKPEQPAFNWDNQYQAEQPWKSYTPPASVGQNFDFGDAFSNFGSYGAPSAAPMGSGSSATLTTVQRSLRRRAN